MVRGSLGKLGSRALSVGGKWQNQQLRRLNIHEYQGAELMGKFGINVPRGAAVGSVQDVKEVLKKEFPNEKEIVVKSQILAGGPGLGTFKSGLQGGVHIVKAVEAESIAAKMLNQVLVTKQTGPQGKAVGKILPNVYCKRYSTLLAPANEALVPPELLSSKTVWTPDRELGQYEDLVARVTNFHNEDMGFMVLDGDVFDVPIRKDIVHRVVRWQLAKRQQGTHSTKTISEVSGTGRKPYKQKGTGRARHGTLRGCQFRGGATMHGPKPRSHAHKLQKKVRRLGLKIALSARTAEGKLCIFEDLEVPSHKTKNIVQYIKQMDDTKKVLLVDGGDIDKKLKLATQNLHHVNVIPSIGLNVYSILQHDTIVMTRDAINRIVELMHTPISR